MAAPGERRMKRKFLICVFLLACCRFEAAAQSGAPAALDAKAVAGRNLFAQHCVVCHVRTLITAQRTYGPSLSRETLGGQEEVLRAFISEGDSNMPGFKLSLQPDEIGSIVTYLKTLPAPPASPTNPAPR
jgi:mono/diheme cytochrome c family protein